MKLNHTINARIYGLKSMLELTGSINGVDKSAATYKAAQEAVEHYEELMTSDDTIASKKPVTLDGKSGTGIDGAEGVVAKRDGINYGDKIIAVHISEEYRRSLYNNCLEYLQEYTWQPNEVAPILDATAELVAKHDGDFMAVKVSTLKTIVEKCWNIDADILKALVKLI